LSEILRIRFENNLEIEKEREKHYNEILEYNKVLNENKETINCLKNQIVDYQSMIDKLFKFINKND
jgi:hypothetical protein